MRFALISALGGLLVWAGSVVAQQAPTPMAPAPLPESRPTCETQLATWRENGQSFVNQVIEMEAVLRTLRLKLADTTKERDDALEKLKTYEPAPQAAVHKAQ